jgi:hypothetical protein
MRSATTAWPASWYAVSFRSFSDSTMLRRSAPSMHLVLRILEVRHVHLVVAAPRGEQRALVDHIRQIGAAHARRRLGQRPDIHIVGDRHLLQVHAQDAFPALDVRRVDNDLAVEAARPEKRRVEHVGPVRRGEQDDAVVGFEAVHLDQQLIERLLALVVPAAQPRAAMAADGIDLVDEDDARCLRSCPARTGRARARRRRPRTFRRSPSRTSRRTGDPPRRPPHEPAASCRCPAGRPAAHPLADRPPSRLNFCGSFRNSMISSSSSFASSAPDTSAKVTFGVSPVSSLAFDLPNWNAFEPPDCICRKMKIQKPMMSSHGSIVSRYAHHC